MLENMLEILQSLVSALVADLYSYLVSGIVALVRTLKFFDLLVFLFKNLAISLRQAQTWQFEVPVAGGRRFVSVKAAL